MRTSITIAVLLAILAGAVYVAYVGWNLTDVSVPLWGYETLSLGIIFSILVGSGLMALMFYSSRHGFDEPPKLE